MKVGARLGYGRPAMCRTGIGLKEDNKKNPTFRQPDCRKRALSVRYLDLDLRGPQSHV